MLLRRTVSYPAEGEAEKLPLYPGRASGISPVRRRVTQSSSWSSVVRTIVAIEAAFLIIVWWFFSDRLLTSRLWNAHLHIHSPEGDPVWERRRTVGSIHIDHGHNEQLHIPPHSQSLLKPHHNVPAATANRNAMNPQHHQVSFDHSAEIPEMYKGPLLVIGGSDGSGTRAFAHFVRRLGVPMKVDDRESFDVHGSNMFNGQGWPPLGKLVLNVTHSARYELDDLPSEMRETARNELNRLKADLQSFESKFYKHQVKFQREMVRATGVSVGFKAPITMLLLPLLKQVFGKMKYLHVVRDGRDVSLSSNKSPVLKFYESMYPDARERLQKYSKGSYPVLAMHLWNDWNTQAYEWEQAHANDPDFDFLIVRSEDLLDPKTKFDSLVRMATFVESPLTMKDLCCMSREGAVDMGKSRVAGDHAAGEYGSDGPHGVTRLQWNLRREPDKAEEEKLRARMRHKMLEERRRIASGKIDMFSSGMSRNRVITRNVLEQMRMVSYGGIPDTAIGLADKFLLTPKGKRLGQHGAESKAIQNRYGKWRSVLQDEPELSSMLHKEGAEGLAAFGYEPEGRFTSMDSPFSRDYQCDEHVVCDAEV